MFNVREFQVLFRKSGGFQWILRRELIWVVVGQCLAFLGGLVSLKILTGVMGPEGYGQLALGMSIAGLINLFLYGPLGQVVLRFYSVCREKEELGAYFSALKKIQGISAIILLLISALAAILVNYLVGLDWMLLVVTASAFGLISGINGALASLQSAMRRRKIVAFHQVADVWLRALLAVTALSFFSNRSYWALMGFIAGTLLVTLSQAAFALKDKELQAAWRQGLSNDVASMDYFSKFLAYGVPFVVFAGFGSISMYADRWVLQGMLGEEQVGIYMALYQIASAPITLVFGMINQLMVPIIFSRAGAMSAETQVKASNDLLRWTFMVTALVFIFITVLTYYFAAPLVAILTAPVFAHHSGTLWVMVSGLALFNLGQLLVMKGLNATRPNLYIWPKGIQAFSFLFLCYFLVRELNIIGVAIALCGSSIAYLGAVGYVNARIKN